LGNRSRRVYLQPDDPNIRALALEALARFRPLFGLSQNVIPKWLAAKGRKIQIDLAFLDGGNNPMEQITEFRLLDPYMPVGATLMTHDAKLRKGKWLVPYVGTLDNWESKVYDVSAEGLFFARKTKSHSSEESLRAARFHLLQMRCELAEVAAALLPAKLCGMVLKVLPHRLSLRLGQGRIDTGRDEGDR
jgi:hypothetical protein